MKCSQFSVYTMDGDSAFDGEVQFKLQGPDGSSETGCLTLGTGSSNGGLFQVGFKGEG